MHFSWAGELEKAKKMKVRRERQLAVAGNPDFRILHPDEYREAQQGKFIMLDKRVLEKINKHNKLAMDRRQKHVGTG